ncbi:guanylate kinase [Humidisolicoccus flavus]|uniref:guanylate kinase n=1 Tax=Humidisolicoccus flavus TaxID=3111414 RepID=UPI003246AC4D
MKTADENTSERAVPDASTGSAAAVAARRARAEIKRSVTERQRNAIDVAEVAWRDPNSPEARMRVKDLLGAIPTLGPARIERALRSLDISPSKRLGGLGVRQRPRLQEWLEHMRGKPRPRRLIVLAGPTAVGKGTVAQYVREHYPEVRHSVSATTRARRHGEIDGVHYQFVTDAQFDAMVEAEEFLEWATVHNAYRYGTPRTSVERTLQDGHSVLLEIDLQGARQIKERMPGALLIFLAPPSWNELVRRLIGRGTEAPAEQQRRLETAKVELAAKDEFDAVVINHDVATAAREVVALVESSGDSL